jgi:hypothetical protein
VVGGIGALDVVILGMVVLSAEQANDGAMLYFAVGKLVSEDVAPYTLLDKQWCDQFLSFGGGPEQQGWVVDEMLDERTICINKSKGNRRIFLSWAFVTNSPNWGVHNQEAITDCVLLQLLEEREGGLR